MRPDERESVARGAALLLALFSLTDRQRYVVIQRHVCGRKLQSLADELRTSRQAICMLDKKGLAKLRVALSDMRSVLEDVAA